MRYDVWDIINIKQEDEIPPSWDWDYKSMGKYCGKKAVITKVWIDDVGKVYYHVDIDDGEHLWTEEMFSARKENIDDLYSPEFENDNLYWNTSSLLKRLGLGRITGNVKYDFNKDKLKFTADLEGNRELIFEIKEK